MQIIINMRPISDGLFPEDSTESTVIDVNGKIHTAFYSCGSWRNDETRLDVTHFAIPSDITITEQKETVVMEPENDHTWEFQDEAGPEDMEDA